MIKEFFVGLVIMAFVLPFTYIIIADLADIIKRLKAGFNRRVKPALIVITKTFID